MLPTSCSLRCEKGGLKKKTELSIRHVDNVSLFFFSPNWVRRLVWTILVLSMFYIPIRAWSAGLTDLLLMLYLRALMWLSLYVYTLHKFFVPASFPTAAGFALYLVVILHIQNLSPTISPSSLSRRPYIAWSPSAYLYYIYGWIIWAAVRYISDISTSTLLPPRITFSSHYTTSLHMSNICFLPIGQKRSVKTFWIMYVASRSRDQLSAGSSAMGLHMLYIHSRLTSRAWWIYHMTWRFYVCRRISILLWI